MVSCSRSLGEPVAPFTLTESEAEELAALLQLPFAKEHGRAQALVWLGQGYAVEEVADLLGVSRQTVYNWMARFRQRSDLDLRARLADAPRSGRPPSGQGVIEPLIAAVFDHDPRTLGYHATTWTAPLLRQYLSDHHQVEVSRKTISRALDRLDLRWKRPRHQLARRPDTWRQAKGGSSGVSRSVSVPSG